MKKMLQLVLPHSALRPHATVSCIPAFTLTRATALSANAYARARARECDPRWNDVEGCHLPDRHSR